jgi:hypothetical protein
MEAIYKKYKSKLIKKYKSKRSQKQDNFITIDDYLAVELSKGPYESSSNIYYHYQSYHNIYNFFNIISVINGFNKILCMPDFFIKYKNTLLNITIVYFTDTNEIIIPNDTIEEFKKCKSKTNIRFIYSTLIIDTTSNTGISHANMLIIDLFEKTIERFEPYGKYIGDANKYTPNNIPSKLKNITTNIDYIIDNNFKELLGLTNFKYISPIDLSPLIGPQSLSDSYNGMCVSITMLYLHLRILNPDVNQSIIINYLVEMSKEDLKNIILRYTKYIEIMLKKYDSIVINTDNIRRENFNKIKLYIVSTNKENKYIQKRNIKRINNIFL